MGDLGTAGYVLHSLVLLERFVEQTGLNHSKPSVFVSNTVIEEDNILTNVIDYYFGRPPSTSILPA